MKETMTDEALLKGIMERDAAALREMLSRFGQRVMDTAYRFLLNRQDAEDITQEVFIEILQSAPGFRARSSLSTWVYRIAVSKCLDELKRRKRKKRVSSTGPLMELSQVSERLEGGVAADSGLEQKQRMELIRGALARLPDNQRVAFTLSRVNGYSNQEIADIMNISKTAVESLVHRARARLRSLLEKLIKKPGNW